MQIDDYSLHTSVNTGSFLLIFFSLFAGSLIFSKSIEDFKLYGQMNICFRRTKRYASASAS